MGAPRVCWRGLGLMGHCSLDWVVVDGKYGA